MAGACPECSRAEREGALSTASARGTAWTGEGGVRDVETMRPVQQAVSPAAAALLRGLPS